MKEPKLDILFIETHNSFNIGIGDLTQFPTNFNIVNPSIEITPPGYNQVTLDFTSSSINLYDSLALGITCEDDDKVKVPDGLYKVKYSITPTYKYFVERTFFRVDNLQEALDEIFIKLDIAQCDRSVSSSDMRKLNEIEMYIQFAIAAANKCANVYAIESYQKAVKLVNNYNKNHCETC